MWKNASKVGHPFLSDEFLKLERRKIPETYMPDGETWVAVENESVVGFTILHGNGVGALFVNPSSHGLVIGQALMNKALGIHRELEVEVFRKNVIGRKFYSAYGFNLVQEYYHDELGFDMLRLQFTSPS